MQDPNNPNNLEVDPSEGAIEEGAEQSSIEAADAEGEPSAMMEVDPSEGPME
jgi:hypothetical protein